MQKAIQGIDGRPRPHRAVDAFPARSLLHRGRHGTPLSPVPLPDHAGPHHLTPAFKRSGAGRHPHRGSGAVTSAYDGEVAHHDSTGAAGVAGPEEFHPTAAVAGAQRESPQRMKSAPG